MQPATASQLASNGPVDPSVGPMNVVDVNWVFFDRLHPHDQVDPIKIPMRRKFKDYRSLIVGALLDEFNFEAIPNTIQFWKFKSDMPLDTVETPGWTQSIRDFPHAFVKISYASYLETALGTTINNKELVHFAVVAEGVYKKRPRISGPGELLEFARYERIIATEGMSPSLAVKSTNYIKIQAKEDQCVHDGLITPFSVVVTMAPPLEIFHPIFGQFIHDVNDTQLQPNAEIVDRVLDIMGFSSAIQTDGCALFLNKLSNILGTQVSEEWNIDVTGTDGMVTFDTKDGVYVPLLIVQRKWALGGGGCDPSIQAGYSMRQAWIQPSRAEIRNESCCPTFLLASGGPWLCVLGGVFTDKFIVQRLTDMMWIGYSSTHEASRIYRLAQVMTVLSRSLTALREFYRKVAAHTSPTLNFACLRHRFYPYPTFFLTEGGEKVYFDYVRPLERGDPRCVTYLAKLRDRDSREIVVKFVDRYGDDAHRFLAEQGYAPPLLYYGPLLAEDSTADQVRPTPRETAPGTSWAPGMMMAVMGFVQGQHLEGPLPEDIQEQLQKALRMLHARGFVFGDLRKPNFLIDLNGKVKMIDFDWSGRYDTEIQDEMDPGDRQFPISKDIGTTGRTRSGFVHYPTGLSPDIEWAYGVKPLAAIRPERDRRMLEMMCS